MNHLVVFARWPAPGRGKTRLTPALAPELKSLLSEAMLRDVLEVGRATAADQRWLAWAEAPEGSSLPFAAETGFRETRQSGGDLGARLEHAFAERLLGQGDRVVVAGADAPGLTPRIVADAFARLASHDVVLAPAADGGYSLLGLARPLPPLFENIPWGSDRVVERTLENAASANLTVSSLEPLDDVDTPEDLVRLIVRSLSQPEGWPHTRRALVGMNLLPERAARG